jgi:hypothetical protein
MFDLFEELKALVEALSERNLEYAVCGGVAMAIHGAPRATVDIDLLVRSDDLSAVIDVARNRGFDVEASPMSFKGGAIQIRRISKISRDGVLMLDLLLVTPAVDEVWRTRVWVEWEYGLLSVVSREGLIQLKRLAGRHRDLDDIERLEDETS